MPDGAAWTLHFEDLSKRYGPEILFEDLSFRIGPGDAVRLRGPNGAGKTQLLLCLGGFVGLDSGQIELHRGESRRRLRATPWHRDSILRFVPGLPGSIRELEVALATHALARDLSPFSLANVSNRAAASFAHRKPWLEECLTERLTADRRMSALSIGQQKRLMLASVLAGPCRPLALLVDEPLAGLDRHGIEMVMRLFGQARDEGVALLVAEHRSDIEAMSFDAEVSLPHRRRTLAGPRSSLPARPEQEATSASVAARAPSSLLDVRAAVVGYPERRIACQRLSIAPGELVLIEGNNGSGKTGFLKGLLGIPPANLTGEIFLDGNLVGSLASAQAEGRVRYMDQARQSFDGLRTTEAFQVAAPAGVAPPAVLEDAVAVVGTRKRVSALSAGNRALLTLCQTLATRPALAVLDEPFANVDATNRQRMVALVERAREDWGTAFLIVEHTAEQLAGARRLRIEGEPEVGAPPRLAPSFSLLVSMEGLR